MFVATFFYMINGTISVSTAASTFKRIKHRRTNLIDFNTFSNGITKLSAKKTNHNNRKGGKTNTHSFGAIGPVTISNNRIVVGAHGYDSYKGAAYVFTKDDSRHPQYSQVAMISANDGAEYDEFGGSVDMDGDTIVVGASGAGAVYVFRILLNDDNHTTTRITSVTQLAKIVAKHGSDASEYFGRSVALHGNSMLVGAYGVDVRHGMEAVGSAYLFVDISKNQNNPEWTQLIQFQPDDLSAFDNFGKSVALDEDTAVITSYDNRGSVAYIFERIIANATTSDNVDATISISWTQTSKLVCSTNAFFGSSVALAKNRIVVGTYDHTIGSGAVFVFTKNRTNIFSSSSSSSSWTHMAQLMAEDGSVNDYFGTAVAITSDASTIAVGSNLDGFRKSGVNSGAVYVFRADSSERKKNRTENSGEWTQIGKIDDSDRNTNDILGTSIAIDDNILVVGASWDETTQTASMYVLDTSVPMVSHFPKESTSSSSAESANKNGLSRGAIIGLTVATVCVVGVAFLIAFRRRSSHGNGWRELNDDPEEGGIESENPISSPSAESKGAAVTDVETLIFSDELVQPPCTPTPSCLNDAVPTTIVPEPY
jgi:hypothetical protein